MGMVQTSRWCLHCQQYTLHARNSFTFSWGCLASILTGCIFLPIWLLIVILEPFFATWRCQVCGTSGGLAYPPNPGVPGSPIPLPAPATTTGPAAPAQPALPPMQAGPSFWDVRVKPFLAYLGSLPGLVWDGLKQVYGALPEWAQPIIWGLGIGMPLLVAMLVARSIWHH